MSLIEFLRLIYANIKLIAIAAILGGAFAFLATMNKAKSYASYTTIYTGVASGQTIEGPNRADYFNTNMAFDNILTIINSRETKEEVVLRLMAQHMHLEMPITSIIGPTAFESFHQLFTPEKIALYKGETEQATFEKLNEACNSSDTNDIYQIVNSLHEYYSVYALDKYVECERIGASDLVKINFESTDPGICRQTLDFLSQVFMKNNIEIKKGQSNSVVEYFEEQVQRAKESLSMSEDKFLQFNKDNNIINYYEQTKHISAKKEELDDYLNNVKMELAGGEMVLKGIEAELGNKDAAILHRQEVLEKRKLIADLAAKITLSELTAAQLESDATPIENAVEVQKTTGKRVLDNKGIARVQTEDTFRLSKPAPQASKQTVDKMIKLRADLKRDLDTTLTQLYQNSHSKNGVSMPDLLRSWLANAIVVDESKAKMEVLRNRQEEFMAIYKTMAPIGAELKTIEREIDVNEQEYLNLVHNLAQAKLRQQNIELSSQLKIIDPAFLPLRSAPAKRGMLIVLGFMGGLVLSLVIVVLMELFNSTMKNQEVAGHKSGLEIAGVVPRFETDFSSENLQAVLAPAIKQTTKTLVSHFGILDNKHQLVVLNILSTRMSEGRKTVAALLANYWHESDFPVYVVVQNEAQKAGTIEFLGTNATPNFELLTTEEFSANKPAFGLVLREVSPLVNADYSHQEVKAAQYSLLVLRSNRSWANADKVALANYSKLANHPILAVLNGVKVEVLESVIGEIPKQRNAFRKTIKRWASLEFKSRSHI